MRSVPNILLTFVSTHPILIRQGRRIRVGSTLMQGSGFCKVRHPFMMWFLWVLGCDYRMWFMMCFGMWFGMWIVMCLCVVFYDVNCDVFCDVFMWCVSWCGLWCEQGCGLWCDLWWCDSGCDSEKVMWFMMWFMRYGWQLLAETTTGGSSKTVNWWLEQHRHLVVPATATTTRLP